MLMNTFQTCVGNGTIFACFILVLLNVSFLAPVHKMTIAMVDD